MQAANSLTPVTLDSSSAIKLTMGSQMLKERTLMGRNDVWHKVKIIRGARYEKELVLRSILSAVEPADLIPVRYEVNMDDAYFMARNCGAALEKLCQSNLIINICDGVATVLVVTLAFASIHDLKINIQPVLLAALTKRYDTNYAYLELENFHRDPDVAKTVYCPLSQTKTLAHTLKLAKTALGPYKRLSLRANDLSNLAALGKSDLSSLVTLDLRRNNIANMNALSALKNFPLEELWLDGNPLCENYRNPQRYVASTKVYCPLLKKLDGVVLDTTELPTSRDHCYTKSSETPKIVEQFVEHFFRMYDRADRKSLKTLYRENSFYSMTLDILANSKTRQKHVPFASENRNLLGSSDLKKFRKLLYRGPEQIIAAFESLPASLHDRRNFRYDVTWEDYSCIVFNVEGFFETNCNPSTSKLYAFSRTFVLAGCADNEYYVLNDQSHVIVPHQLTAFFHKIDRTKVHENEERADNRDSELTPNARDRMIFTLMNVTTMNNEWCRRLLEDANWNAEKAIKKFIDNYKSASIPAEAFGR